LELFFLFCLRITTKPERAWSHLINKRRGGLLANSTCGPGVKHLFGKTISWACWGLIPSIYAGADHVLCLSVSMTLSLSEKLMYLHNKLLSFEWRNGIQHINIKVDQDLKKKKKNRFSQFHLMKCHYLL